jgi:hypothetical protein
MDGMRTTQKQILLQIAKGLTVEALDEKSIEN